MKPFHKIDLLDFDEIKTPCRCKTLQQGERYQFEFNFYFLNPPDSLFFVLSESLRERGLVILNPIQFLEPYNYPPESILPFEVEIKNFGNGHTKIEEGDHLGLIISSYGTDKYLDLFHYLGLDKQDNNPLPY